MNKISNSKAQFLVRTSGGLDYCRVEPWEGGQPAAESGAQRIGGYVVALDESLCVTTDSTGDPLIVADYRAQALEVTRAQLAPAPFSPDCDACYWEQKGWGGSGCCETCDRYSYEHTCAESTKEKQ